MNIYKQVSPATYYNFIRIRKTPDDKMIHSLKIKQTYLWVKWVLTGYFSQAP